MAMCYEAYTVLVKEPSELFTRNDYARLIEMINRRDIKGTPLSKAIKTKNHGYCRYEFSIGESDYTDLWKDGLLVRYTLERDNHSSGCGRGYNLDELKALPYEKIKSDIFRFFELEESKSIEPIQLSIFDLIGV